MNHYKNSEERIVDYIDSYDPPSPHRPRRTTGTIAAVLDAARRDHPDAAAVEAVSGVWTYAELDDRADRAAGALWSLGVRPGDRVAACLPNDLDIVAAFHEIGRASCRERV